MTSEDQALLYANTVVPLIEESGFTVTLTKPNKGSYDPDTGYIPGVAETTIGSAIEEEFSVDAVPTSIAEKVKKVILAIEIDKPVPNEDTITMKGSDYQVLAIEPLEPGEVLFFYTVYLGA